MMPGIFDEQYSGDIICAYPLDDNGTLASAFGYGYAGPAVGDGQQMQYTTTGSASIRILVAAGAVTSARFQRAASPIGYEAEVISYGGAFPQASGLAIVLTNAGGAVVNAAAVPSTADGDLIQFEVSATGVVTAQLNGTPFNLAPVWLNPMGQTTVGATDYFAPYLWINDQFTGQIVDIQLVTDHASMIGAYSSGAVDICGNLI